MNKTSKLRSSSIQMDNEESRCYQELDNYINPLPPTTVFENVEPLSL